MTDPLNGLRFDIYERVHLPDDVAAIEELEEIELVPHMQALPQDDQVLLRGHLLLSGVYQSQGGSGLSQLEHWIPVEIALPLNRIQSVEELAVEIDNFDVDLLTTRSLNVTGVLALRGCRCNLSKAQFGGTTALRSYIRHSRKTLRTQALSLGRLSRKLCPDTAMSRRPKRA